LIDQNGACNGFQVRNLTVLSLSLSLLYVSVSWSLILLFVLSFSGVPQCWKHNSLLFM
jgi:hypothetical protein